MNSTGKKIIWIIGAGSGIGRSLAINLSRQGHQLILSGRRVNYLENLKNEYIQNAMIIPLDVTQDEEIKTSYEKIRNEFISIDSIIFMSADYQPMTIDNLDLEKCRHIINTNVISAFSILHAVVADFKNLGQGQLVFCGSVAGYRGLSNGQPYSASKAALINFSETARIELAPFGIDIKIINPGFVKTEMTDKNSFVMPMMISPDVAADRIAAQIFNRNRFEIKTHSFFSVLMKVIRILPYSLYFRLMRK